MPREKITQNIDGVDYTFLYLNTSKALAVASEIGKRAAPFFAAIASSADKDALAKLSKKEKEAKEAEGIRSVFLSLGEALDPDVVVRLCKELCAVVACSDGMLDQGAIFETHFQGRPSAAIQVAAKSFEVNCGDFFAFVGKAVSNRKFPLTTPVPTSK
jgi:hypothetical protein